MKLHETQMTELKEEIDNSTWSKIDKARQKKKKVKTQKFK